MRVHASDHDVQEFAPRDLLPVVRNLLAQGTPVLIEGPSMAGKTRLAAQTLTEGWGSAPLWFPTDDDGITRLIESGQDPTKGTVVFLDDVDRFLSNGSLTLTLLEKWHKTGCIIVATITASKYAQWRDDSATKRPGWDAINRFSTRHLSPMPSEGELVAMRSTGYADLIDDARNLGLPAILGGAPLARQKFREGAEARSWGWAIVRAAADWRRIGLGSVTTEQLQDLARVYPDTPVAAEDWPAAWNWASKPFNHTVALVSQVRPDKWEVLDILADDASWPLYPAVLTTITTFDLNPVQLTVLAVHFHLKTENYDQTEQMYKRAIKADPNNDNFLSLYASFLTYIRRDHDRAEQMYERAIQANPNNANDIVLYAIFLHTIRLDHDQAEQMYERAIKADPNNANILHGYAYFLGAFRRDHDQAEAIYQRAIKADPNNANNIGNYASFLIDVRRRGAEALLAQNLFYLFIYAPDDREASGSKLKALLIKGTSTITWEFSQHLQRREQEGDPRLPLLKAVAEALRKGDPTGLDEFEEWRALN